MAQFDVFVNPLPIARRADSSAGARRDLLAAIDYLFGA
jgi:hypothetical protein